MVLSIRIRALIICVLAVLALTGGANALATNTDTVTEIDSCTTITEPGTYELTEDIEDSEEERCIDIRVDGEVILDGNGHLIDGVGDDNTVGIFALATRGSSYEISDVEVSDWDEGIRANRVTGNAFVGLEGIEAHHNKDGIKNDGVSLFSVYESETYENSDDGIHIRGGLDNYLTRNEVYDNGDDGIYFENAFDSAAVDNDIWSNGDDGIDVQASSDMRSIEGNNITDNADDGIYFRDTIDEENIIDENRVTDNHDDGIDLREYAGTLRDNTVCGNEDRQIIDRYDGSSTTDEENC